MTNSKTSQCGIYELPKRIIETETGYNRETVDKLLNRFIDYKKIVSCEETREVFFLNWIKHNKIVSPKVKKCVYEELKKIKSMDMVNLFFKQCEGYGYTLDKSEIKINMGMDRVSIPYPYRTDTSRARVRVRAIVRALSLYLYLYLRLYL